MPTDWQEHYKRNTVSAEEAVRAVRSGDTVALSIPPQPRLLMDALVARKGELTNVQILTHAPNYDPGWLQPGWEESFRVTVMMYLGDTARPAYDEKRIDYWPMIFSHELKAYEEERIERRQIDVFMPIISPPDERGFCSFGYALWDKRRLVQSANRVIAQVDEGQIRTYGMNHIHVSEVDYFVEHTPPEMSVEEAAGLIRRTAAPECRNELERISLMMLPAQRQESLADLCQQDLELIRGYARIMGFAEPSEIDKKIAANVAGLIRDGDTVQVGIGTPSGLLPRLGIFDGKKDLGVHSEMGARGVIKLIEKGVINGSRKTINRGVAVFAGLDGCSPDEIAYGANNPLIEQRDTDYVVNIQTLAAHDNMVTMNNAISVDLTGQINSETVFGPRLLNGTGGQPELHMGAVLSNGGRAITLLRSTAVGGAVSRIVPQLEKGSIVTIPRTYADFIVTEYGVAKLLGKSLRERARELIAIAHPDFRSDLEKAAQRLYYP